MSLLSIKDLNVRFELPRGSVVEAVNGISLDFEPGKSLGIVGESGSGKTQLVLSILGLLAKNARVEGSIEFENQELVGLSQKEYAKIRGNHIAMIFQDPMTSLNPYLTIERQMSEVLQTHEGITRKEAKARAVHALDMVEIPEAESRLFLYPHELSGGMRQRVMIAMALLCQPKILLADEPTTALDVTVQSQILKLLKKLRKETGVSIALITHNLGVVASACEEVAVMYGGQVMEKGLVDNIFENPLNPYTEALLRSMPKLASNKEKLFSIPGSPPNLQNLPQGCPFAPRCTQVHERCLEENPSLIAYSDSSYCACFATEAKKDTVPQATNQGALA